MLFAGAIALVAALHYRFGLNAVASFWIAYILTRPLGASTGDLLSQPRHDGGLGLGTTVTSVIFLVAILVVVTFLSDHQARRHGDRSPPASQPHAQVLVVAHRTAATPALLDAVRTRAAQSAASFHLLVPNPAQHAEITDAERRSHHQEGEQVLEFALPLLEQAAGGAVEGSVSARHDPMDVIEEALHDGEFHEVILSTLPHHISDWLHADLRHRIEHLGVPVTTVTATA